MRTKRIACVLALVFALSIAIPLAAQNPTTTNSAPHTFIPRAVFDALAKTDGDHPARVVDIAKSYNLGAYMLRLSPRKPTTTTMNGWAHHDISELYYVIKGSGTFLIGGQLLNPKQDDPNTESVKTVRGPSMTGEIKDYKVQKYQAGDVIIIPVGVAHFPTYEVTETAEILRVVIDPQRAVNLK
jgi:mannose-6-phosphate isomerase-like protein (cupin superfamily)